MSSSDVEADDIDLQLIFRTFQAESNERLAEMEELLLKLESCPGDEEAIQAIFRGAHTIKGNSESLGLMGTKKLSHAMEDVLHRLRSHTLKASPALVSFLLRTVDVLKQMIADGCAGKSDELPELPSLVETLRTEWLEDVPAATESSPEPAIDTAMTEIPGAASAEAGNSSQSSSEAGRSLRVDMERVDRMVNLSGEIVIAQARMRDLITNEQADRADILEFHRVTDNLCRSLQEHIMRLRMVPVGPFFRRYSRVVRDLARKINKQARLVIEGAEVEVDSVLVDHLKDPVTHMVRNAVDHGIEPAEVRRTSGKHPCGQVILRAFHDGGSVVIQVSDDGAGFDRARILKKALHMGLITDADRVREEDLFLLVLQPGFSTSEEVTDLSGRGVGMDVVARNIELLGGVLSIESSSGQGTTLTARVPLTLAIIEGLLVGVDEDRYIVPLDLVEECFELVESKANRSRPSGMVRRHGRIVPFIRLRNSFRLETAPPERENVVIVRWLGGHIGVVVDILLGENRTVVKPLGKLLKGVRGFAAATLLGDGQVALILDVGHLVQQAEQNELRSELSPGQRDPDMNGSR